MLPVPVSFSARVIGSFLPVAKLAKPSMKSTIVWAKSTCTAFFSSSVNSVTSSPPIVILNVSPENASLIEISLSSATFLELITCTRRPPSIRPNALNNVCTLPADVSKSTFTSSTKVPRARSLAIAVPGSNTLKYIGLFSRPAPTPSRPAISFLRPILPPA